MAQWQGGTKSKRLKEKQGTENTELCTYFQEKEAVPFIIPTSHNNTPLLRKQVLLQVSLLPNCTVILEAVAGQQHFLQHRYAECLT